MLRIYGNSIYDEDIVYVCEITYVCRTAIHKNVNGKPGSEKRGNLFPVTLNIPRLAIKVMNIEDKEERLDTFFKSLDKLLLDARESTMHRYDVLKQLKGKDLPFIIGENLYQDAEEVGPEDSIEPVLKNGTIGFGFVGLAETLTALVGFHHAEYKGALELGLKIVKKIYDFTEEYSVKDGRNYSCYFTPAETCGYKMMKKDKADFGIIEGVTDKEYYTNSIHVPVNFPISYVDKLYIEGQFHKYGTGGRISYIEFDDVPTPETIHKVLSYTKDRTDISYLGINFRIKYCKDCGHDVPSALYECPACGSSNIQGVSRVTGYLSLDERFGPGKDAERRDRISHDSKFNNVYRDLYNK